MGYASAACLEPYLCGNPCQPFGKVVPQQVLEQFWNLVQYQMDSNGKIQYLIHSNTLIYDSWHQ